MRSVVPALFVLLAIVPSAARADCAVHHFCVCDYGATTAVLTQYTPRSDGGVELVVLEVRGGSSGIAVGDALSAEGYESFDETEQVLVAIDGGTVTGRVGVIGDNIYCPTGSWGADVSVTMDAMLATDCRQRLEKETGVRETSDCRDTRIGPFFCSVSPSSGVLGALVVLGFGLRGSWRRRNASPGFEAATGADVLEARTAPRRCLVNSST